MSPTPPPQPEDTPQTSPPAAAAGGVDAVPGIAPAPGQGGQYALFVDVGYLYAASGELVHGVKERRRLRVDAAGIIGALLARAARQLQPGRLLRVYWFDAARDRVPTIEQRQVARRPHVKVRLGNLNASGQQKGVDALLRADVQGLAENRAITDVVLLAGDEDMLPAVEAAQAYGVRVHLWGIEAAYGRNQSERLQWEADTVATLDADVVAPFVQASAPAPSVAPAPAAGGTPAPQPTPPAAAAPAVPSPAELAGRAARPAPTAPATAPVVGGVAGLLPADVAGAYRGREMDWMEELGEHIANVWLVERGRDNLADLLPGPTLPQVIDQELLWAAEDELGHSLRAYKEARAALRRGFWSRLYREFGMDAGAPH